MRILIHHWDAVELFCQIIAKLEGRSIVEFYNCTVLQDALEKYAVTATAKEASETAIKRQNTLLSLVSQIRTKEPVVLTALEFKAISNYIGEENKVPGQVLKDIWVPQPKAGRFVGRWWLYFYEEINHSPGIVRAVMTLKPFSKAIIDSLKGDSGDKEFYTGKYHMSGTDAKYMRMFLTLDTKEKDLHMLFYIGSDVPQLALGQYNDMDGAIYSGTAIIQKTEGAGYRSAAFFPFQERSSKIPDYIWQYFEDKRLNRLRVPSEITDVKKLKSWLDLQQKKGTKAQD